MGLVILACQSCITSPLLQGKCIWLTLLTPARESLDPTPPPSGALKVTPHVNAGGIILNAVQQQWLRPIRPCQQGRTVEDPCR